MLRKGEIFLIILVLSFPAFASDEDIFNVDFFCGWGGYYRPMEWTPMEISISSILEEPFGGFLTISAKQDEMNTLNIRNEFVLTPDMPLHLPLVTKLAFAADKCNLRISNERNKTLWDNSINLWDFSGSSPLLTAVTEKDLLIGVVGRSAFGLILLPKQSICTSNTGNGNVYLGDKQPRMVPWDWTGFVSLDLLVLYNPEWDLFNEHQLNAIVQWVSNGGKLLLVTGSRPLPNESPITKILPFEVQQAKQITLPSEILRKWNLLPGEPETITCRPLAPKPNARFYENQTVVSGECPLGIGYVGFGRVGVLAFDPAGLSTQQRANSTRFWVSIIRAILEDTDSPERVASVPSQSSMPRPYRSVRVVGDVPQDKNAPNRINRYEVGLSQGANYAVMEHLYNIAEMRPLSIWWVILLLGTLAVLLGPVDYKLLKRIDRLPLTWLTCTFWIVLFSVGAYYGVRALRGGKLQFRVVSVLDKIENNDLAWSTRYCGLFASHSDDYRLEGLNKNQWWSGIAPTQSTVWASYNQNVASRRIYCLQHDGGNLPVSLPVNIWTIQCLMDESTIEQMPFKAEVEVLGDQVTVHIVNESDSPIRNGYCLLANNRGIEFGPVSPRSDKQFSSSFRRVRNWEGFDSNRYRRIYVGNSPIHFINEDAFFAQGCLQRTQAIEAYLAGGAAVVCAQYDQAPIPFAIKDNSCHYTHTQMARLVVFPKTSEGNLSP
jgi:hypothetical protein